MIDWILDLGVAWKIVISVVVAVAAAWYVGAICINAQFREEMKKELRGKKSDRGRWPVWQALLTLVIVFVITLIGLMPDVMARLVMGIVALIVALPELTVREYKAIHWPAMYGALMGGVPTFLLFFCPFYCLRNDKSATNVVTGLFLFFYSMFHTSFYVFAYYLILHIEYHSEAEQVVAYLSW